MLNVFKKISAEELQVELSNGRIMALEDLVRDYERLLKEESSKKSTASKLKVGEWFKIDREVIDKSKKEIHHKCNEEGKAGKALWKRFEKSNKIADENPDQYPRLIETYIFKHNWEYKTEQEMRDMCKELGDGMCDEIICDLELQMRIVNGESVEDLVKKDDKLPQVRIIKLRNGGTGYFGGGVQEIENDPPAYIYESNFISDYESIYTPYAFRRSTDRSVNRNEHCFTLLKPKQN